MSDILQYIHEDAHHCAQYTVHGVVPNRVAFPTTVAEVSALMHHAAQQGWRVVPWGGGSHQLIGAPPQQVDLVVVTRQLNRVLQHEPNDLTISVEAGMTFAELRSYLAQHGQMLPMDPALPEQTTIGGMLACAVDGPRRALYGLLRDVIIGVRVVEINGQISQAGGMVVKNVSGFDMMKLYHGSLGTLALIVSANFKLIPIPPERGCMRAVFADLADAEAFVDAIMASQLTPSACELIDATVLRSVGVVTGVWGVVVAVEGPAAAVARHQHDLAQLCQQLQGTATWLTGDAEVALMQQLADASQVAQLASDELLLRWAVLPGDVFALVRRVQTVAQQIGGHVVVHARASVGSGYVRVHGVTATQQAAWVDAVPELIWLATHCPTLPRYWHEPLGGLTVMRQIRHEFDPQQRLNPGRFLV
jgi:glycolate oxidase FAD binding subunit